MTDERAITSGSYGDHLVALNFVEQCGFHSDRIVIEQYRSYRGRLPRMIIRVGWGQEAADPRDLEILAELEEDFGPNERRVSDAVLEVPAGQLVVMGAYLPQPKAEVDSIAGPHQLDLPFNEPTEMPYIHPVVVDIIRRWRGQAQ